MEYRQALHMLLVFAGLCCIRYSFADEKSWLGTDFAFSIPTLWDIDFEFHYNILVIITTPELVPVDVDVTVPGLNFRKNATVTKYQNAKVFVDRHVKLNGTGLQNKTIFVHSSKKVSVHASVGLAAPDLFLVLPTPQLGRTYYVGSYIDTEANSEFSVTAVKDNTTLRITPPSGNPFHVTLPANESYQYQLQTDVTGTKIESSEPIAVIAASRCPYIPSTTCCCDSIGEQMTPVESWVSNPVFYVAPFLGLTSGLTYRVLTNETARLSVRSNRMVNGQYLTNNTVLNPGEFFEDTVGVYSVNDPEDDKLNEMLTVTIEKEIDSFVSIRSNSLLETRIDPRPVSGMLLQYINGGQLDSRGIGDPSMIIVPPVQSYAHNVTFPVFNPNFQKHPGQSVWRNYTFYINVIINCSYVDGLTFDDNITMSDWDQVTSYDGSMCVIRSNVTNGTHTVGHIDEEARFTVSIYTLTKDESHAYPAGFSLHREKRSPNDGNSESMTMWISIACGSVAALLLVAAVVSYMIRRRSLNKEGDQAPFNPPNMIESCFKLHVGPYWSLDSKINRLPIPPAFQGQQIDRTLLHVYEEEVLGEGSFGVVYKARLYGQVGGRTGTCVAVKTPKIRDGITADEIQQVKDDFLHEIDLCIQITEHGEHPNVLPILGCCTLEEPYFLITPFMKFGDLLKFLRKSKIALSGKRSPECPILNISDKDKIHIAHQIAKGMEFLARGRYYNGDLAARNCLVGENLNVKIADFGLALDMYSSPKKVVPARRRLSYRWISLETLTKGICTEKSDIWSFGVVLFEIYTLGDIPYSNDRRMNNRKQLERELKRGYRLEQPRGCSDEIYDIMMKCWKKAPDDRPSFVDLVKDFDDMLNDMRRQPAVELMYTGPGNNMVADREADALDDNEEPGPSNAASSGITVSTGDYRRKPDSDSTTQQLNQSPGIASTSSVTEASGTTVSTGDYRRKADSDLSIAPDKQSSATASTLSVTDLSGATVSTGEYCRKADSDLSTWPDNQTSGAESTSPDINTDAYSNTTTSYDTSPPDESSTDFFDFNRFPDDDGNTESSNGTHRHDNSISRNITFTK